MVCHGQVLWRCPLYVSAYKKGEYSPNIFVIAHFLTCCFHLATTACPELTNPENGQVDISGTTENSIATYSCNSGYTLSEPITRMCRSDGVWSESEPSCQSEINLTAFRCVKVIFNVYICGSKWWVVYLWKHPHNVHIYSLLTLIKN